MPYTVLEVKEVCRALKARLIEKRFLPSKTRADKVTFAANRSQKLVDEAANGPDKEWNKKIVPRLREDQLR